MVIPSKLGKGSWNCVALPLIQQRPPLALPTSASVQCRQIVILSKLYNSYKIIVLYQIPSCYSQKAFLSLCATGDLVYIAGLELHKQCYKYQIFHHSSDIPLL